MEAQKRLSKAHCSLKEATRSHVSLGGKRESLDSAA